MDHAPGSVVQINLENFVTYTSAEFRCGPSLNMVLGPNGTGKSSLVCAICLGLAGTPSILGRAKDIGEYVKNGCTEARIDVELKAGPLQRGRNPVITRFIKREGNKSTWLLNGSPSTPKEIQSLIKSFNIQIDNLCQFLPQDRVVEFAALSNTELLRETQKTVGDPQMSEWHNQLRTLGQDRKKTVGDKQHLRKTLEELTSRQSHQKDEVDRLQERVVLQERHEALKKYKPFLEYNVEKLKYDEARERKKIAKNMLRRLEQQAAPALEDVSIKSAYLESLLKVQESSNRLIERFKSNADAKIKKIESLKVNIDEVNREINNIQQAKSSRKPKIARHRSEIARLQRKLQTEPPSFDLTEYNSRKRLAESNRRTKKQELDRILEDINSVVREYKETKKETESITQEIDNLRTKSGKQMGFLKNLSPDTCRAMELIEKNKNKFENEIFGPPVITCSIKKPEIAAFVESVLQRNDLMTFTVQSERDSRTLQDLLFKQNRLADIAIRTMTRNMNDFKSPFDSATLQRYQFEGVLINAIDGPEKVLAVICENTKMHKIAYTKNNVRNNLEELTTNSSFDRFIIKNSEYVTTRRAEYGRDAVNSTVRQIKAKGIWTEGGSALQRVDKLTNDLDTKHRALQALKEQLQPLKTQEKEFNNEIKKLTDEINEIDQQKSALQNTRSEWEILPNKIIEEKENMDRLLETNKEDEESISQHLRTIEKHTQDRSQLAIDFASAIDIVRKATQESLILDIRTVEAQSDVVSLKQRNKDITDQLEQREDELNKLNQQMAELQQNAQHLSSTFKKSKQASTEEEKRIQDDFERECETEGTPQGSARLAQLEAELTSLIHRLSLVGGGNPRVIEEFNKRAEEIEKLSSRLDSFDRDVSNLDDQIQAIKSKWEPELDKMIQKVDDAFQENFKRIKCLGEVSVYKPEGDYSEWAIHIKTQFRDGEGLSLLDAHRQSGGERSVTTIFYLLSLQSQARSPFRVVDEINQGMDPRNERMVHERMVDIACAEDTSQYFLITPKLLSGLKYHERMVVHTIYSGEKMPSHEHPLDFGKLADIALRVAGKIL